MRTCTASSGRPSESARTIAITVRVPVPMSCEEILASAVASGWIVTSQLLRWPRPPQVWIDIPSPRLRGPRAGSPRGCQRWRHPMSWSATSSSSR